jgi:hypothetical protein
VVLFQSCVSHFRTQTRWPPQLNLNITSISKQFLRYKTKSIKIKKKIDEKRAITPRWVIKFTSKWQGR